MTTEVPEKIMAAMLQAASTVVAEKLRAQAQAKLSYRENISPKELEDIFMWNDVGDDIAYALHGIEAGYAAYLKERAQASFPSMED